MQLCNETISSEPEVMGVENLILTYTCDIRNILVVFPPEFV